MEKLDFSKYQPKPPVKSKISNERQEILKEFLTILNSAVKPPYKPMTPARLGMMLAPVKTKELYVFLADCKYASNFSKYFWYSFKSKK